MAEHTSNLQSHFADSDGKVHHLREELARSEAGRLNLQQNLEAKTTELQKMIDRMQSLDKMLTQKSENFQNEIAHLKSELANSEINLANSQHAFEKKAAEAQYLAQLAHTLEDQLVNYQKKMVSLQGESAQLRRELSKCEAKQSELYYRLEQQLDEWLNEKASLESRVDDMEGKFQQSVGAIQGVFSTDQSSVSAKSEGFQDTPGLIQGPQGLVQTLLELGEAFLVSKIGEEDFHELQGKLNAARTRDDNIIRELQHKLQDLSEMGAMVTRLKEELIEEKEKAKEEAEDMTQEMAELRYQLMEMVEHERELRSYTEQASMRRIAELEEQLKHSRQQTMLSLGCRQAAEALSESRALEIRHLKSTLEETRRSHTNVMAQKGEIEEKLTNRLKEHQAKVNGLETDLSKARDEVMQLKVWEEKLVQIEKDSVALEQEREEKLLALEQEKTFLQIGVVEMQQLLKDFKHEIELLAEKLQRSETNIQEASGFPMKDNKIRSAFEASCSLSPPHQDIPAEEQCLIYADEEQHPGGIGPDSMKKEEVKELCVEASFSSSEQLDVEKKLTSVCTKHEVAEKTLQLEDVGNDDSTKEELLTGDRKQEEYIGSLLENQQSQSEVEVLQELQKTSFSSSEHLDLEVKLTSFGTKHEIAEKTLQLEDIGKNPSTKADVLTGDIKQEESIGSLLENQQSQSGVDVLQEHQLGSFSSNLDLEEKLTRFCTIHEVAEKTLQLEDTGNNSSAKEEVLAGDRKQEESMTSLLENPLSESEVDVLQELPYHLQSQLIAISAEREIGFQRLEQQCGDNDTYLKPRLSASSTPSANAHDRNQEYSWPTQEIIELVDSVTEELTKLLRLVLKSPLLTKQDFFLSLESRLHAWSNIPQKNLPAKLLQSGSIGEWGDLVVDLIGQSRRELLAMQHKIKDFEAQEEFNETIRAERISLSKEAAFSKEELARLEVRYTSEVARREEEVCALKKKLEQSNLVLLDTQRKATEQEDTLALLRGKVRKFELEAERSKSAWASEKQLLEEAVREQYGNAQKEKQRGSKEVEKLEKRIKVLLHRLEENEDELSELMELGGINTDAVVAAKLRRLEQDLKDSQATEEDLQAERAELASQVVWLQAKLEEAEQELQAENEQHVEVLIRYEEERGLMETELEAAKRALSLQQTGLEYVVLGKENATIIEKVELPGPMAEHFKEQNNNQSYKKLEDLLFSKEAHLQSEKRLRIEAEMKYQELQKSLEETLFKLSAIESELKSAKREAEKLQNSLHVTEDKLLRSIEEEHSLKESIQLLEEKAREQNQLVEEQKEALISYTDMNKVMSQVSSLELEVLVLRQQLLLCESQVSEKDMTIAKLQEALMLERMKLSQAQEDTNLQAERLTRQEEDYLRLKVKFSSLLTNLASLQANLGQTRKRESETQVLVNKLELELSVAKEEVLKSEVRLQKTLKQAKEQLYGERRKLEDAINGQKQSEWFLARQLERLQNLEGEKVALQTLVDQLRATSENAEKERDELKSAYAELENQFSRRSAVGK